VRWIAGRITPCILVDHWCPGLEIDTVNPDNRGAARLGTQRLLAAGHREIAYVFHHKREMNPPRIEGYYDALRAAGIPVRRNLVVLEDLSELGGARAIQTLVRRGARFTAALTFADSQARGALKAARDLKKRLEVVTFGSVNDFGDPALTLIDLRPEEVGRLAVRRLLRRIRSPAMPPEDLVGPVRLAPAVGRASAELSSLKTT
jgi:LacI family transcriptional regulator